MTQPEYLLPGHEKRRKGRQFQGAPCARGHDGIRYSIGGGCVQCARDMAKAKWQLSQALRPPGQTVAKRREVARVNVREHIERALPHIEAAAEALRQAQAATRMGVWMPIIKALGIDPRLAQLLRQHGRQKEDDSWLTTG